MCSWKSRVLGLCSLILFAAALLPAQSVILPYRPVDAGYSSSLSRIVTISGNPNVLHIYDPVAGVDTIVNLTQPPLALSLSPDGMYAAVGHDALISYVNLSTGVAEKTFPVSVTVQNLALAPAWVYVMSGQSATPISVELATGAVTNSSFFFGTNGKLDTAVNAIYGTEDDTSPNDIVRYNVTTGPISGEIDSPYQGNYCVNGPLWFSPEGQRIYTGCGTIFHASTDPNLDRYYLSSFPGIQSIGALTESAALGRIALIPTSSIYPGTSGSDGTVHLFDSSYFQPVTQFTLPPFLVNGTNFAAHGKFVFFNAASTELYVLAQADATSGLLNDFSLLRISMTPPAACGAVFSSGTSSASSAGKTGSVNITASASCVYQAVSNVPWIRIVSGGYSSGNGTLTYTVDVNPGTASRSGSILMGGQTFTLTQDGAFAQTAFQSLGYNVVDAIYDKPLDRLLMVSASPDELHIYDPVAQSEQLIPLSAPPLSLSVRPDGLYAAVGQDGWVSYVNLQSGVVEQVFPVITDVSHVLLAGNGYIYLFPSRDWSDIYSFEIASGTLTASGGAYTGRVPRLYFGGASMYVGGDGYSKWDISQGIAVTTESGGTNTCGNLWLGEDGRRAVTACASTFTTSDIAAQDGQYSGTLSAAEAVVWADDSTQQHQTAVIPLASSSYTGYGAIPAGDTQVQLYGDNDLSYMGAVPIPRFLANGGSIEQHGRFVFWDRAETSLIVVMDPDASAQLQSVSGVARFSPSAAQQVTVGAVVNSASGLIGRVAPGELVTIYGTQIGPAAGVAATVNPIDGRLETMAGGTQIFFNGVAAPLLYTSAGQVNAVVPFEVYPGSTVLMQAGYQGILSTGTMLTVSDTVPGLFTENGGGTGQAIAVNLDGTLCDANHPAAAGSYVVLYFTGGGLTNPGGVTGAIAGSELQYLAANALVTVGGQPATVTYAGSAPGIVSGVGQLNIRLGDGTPSGPAQPVILTVGLVSSPATATIAVK